MIYDLLSKVLLTILLLSGTVWGQSVTTDTLNGTDQVSPVADLTGSNASVVNNNFQLIQNDTNALLYEYDNIKSQIAALPTFPVGAIVMWSGTIASIPTGWFLCNGTNGTPNLSDRFIIAADPTNYPPGSTGNGTLPTTNITFAYSNSGQSGEGIVVYNNDSGDGTPVSLTFGSGSQVIAVYYSLAYIEYEG